MATASSWAKVKDSSSVEIDKGTSFYEATQATLEDGSETVYNCKIPADWCYGEVAHGGFLASLVTRTATNHAIRKTSNPRLIPASTQYHFYAPSSHGVASMDISEIKLRKRSAIIRVRLWQQQDPAKPAQLKVETTVTLEDPAAWKANPLPPLRTRTGTHYGEVWDRTKGFDTYPQKSGGGLFYKFKPKMGFNFLPGTKYTGGFGARTAGLGPSVIECWHRCDENHHIHHLPFTADHLGPILMNFDEGLQFRQLTQSMTVDIVKEPPAEGWEWLFLRHEMVVCQGGRFWIDVIMLDESKDIVAIARHQCVARPFEKYNKTSKL